jgi:two-component system CheB/CheR fusion protein
MTTKKDRPPKLSVCGIGASAGGIEALQQFFDALPPDLGLAYAVIVHLAPDRKSELHKILGRWTTMPVLQVGDNRVETLKPNHVYVIAPDRKLEISDTSIGAAAFEQPRGKRSAIDLFFRSLAETHGDGYAVLLSGAGNDGALGARAVKEHGGLILIQEPTEASHSAMPRAAIAAGVADIVLPVRELATRLAEIVRAKRQMQPVEAAADEAEAAPADDDKALKGVLDVVRKRTGHDFAKYKRSTVLRRLGRRMQLTHQLTIQDYLTFLRSSTSEPQSLLDDLLISVTTFLRDPEAWTALQTRVIAPMVTHADPDSPLRVWVPGCATGEEPYTVAMLFLEEFDRQKQSPNLTIFASDVDEGALAVAREGIYSHAISADVSESRLERFFRSEDDHYRIIPEIRDRVVFAAHNLLRDPPFSRVHLVSCRNLLIYLERDLQEQVMGVFRYACRDDARVFLGASEAASDDLFEAVDKRHRIYKVRPRDAGAHPALPELLNVPLPRSRHDRDLRTPGGVTATALHFSALEEVAPPSVVVDERWHVMHLSPTAARFFQQSGGALAQRVTDLVRPEIRDDLHALLQRTMDTHAPQLSPFFAVRFNGAPHAVAVLAQQRAPTPDGRRDILVTFLDAGEARVQTAVPEHESANELVRTVREQLRVAEQRIEAMRDEHHLTIEDLRAANEELQSLNEEYRSTTEELETSKEELQSINEELHTVNQELKSKLDEVSRANSDLENLMTATNVPTLFLASDLRIKRFTPQLGEIFKIKSRDLDRPISDLKHSLEYDLEEDARRVLATSVPLERAARSDTGRSYVVRLGPYRTAGGRGIDGVVATFVDVTEIKSAELALRHSESRLETELNVMRRLHEMTLRVATAPDLRAALDHVIATAIELHSADFGNVQLLDADSGKLRIVAHRGFGTAFLTRFASTGRDDESACGRALRTGRVVQIADVNADAAFEPYRDAAADAGYRAVQSMPLTGKHGEPVGVLSLHFRDVHAFTERDAQLADMLGRVAADLMAERIQLDRMQTVNTTLQQRTAELETSEANLSRSAAELVEQNERREEFLAALGHELRNPLAAIQASLALMTAADDRSQKALDVLRRQGQHMTRLVSDLLDVTRVRRGTVRLERASVDLQEICVSAVEAARPSAERKHLALECQVEDPPLLVDADPERLAQILDNLLRNAVNYTDLGSVTVLARKDGSFARVVVRDSGIGIAAEDQVRLFEPYNQVAGRRRAGDGLGLGLSLVKALVVAHGGTVGGRSAGLGHGSEFEFTIPLATATTPPAIRRTPLKQPASRRVLVVDDQRDVADTLASLLGVLGQQVLVAYDAESAIALARQGRPEIAFLDVAMPGVNGSDLTHQLRQEFGPAELLLVAVSGHDNNHAIVQRGQFDRHLLKPLTMESIIAVLNAARERSD